MPTPSQSRRSPTGSSPQIAAVGVDVVGLRTPTVATSLPTRALKIEDLPLPVAPARATTVWPPTSAVRSVTFATTASAARALARGELLTARLDGGGERGG